MYTAQVVAAQSAVDGVFPPVAPLALQLETSSQADAVDEAVVAVVAATVRMLSARQKPTL